MTHDPLAHLLAPTRQMAVLLSMRLLPFAVYNLFKKGTELGLKKVLMTGAYLAFPLAAWWLGAQSSIGFLAAGATYYLLVSLGVNWLSGLIAADRLSRGAALVVIFFAYLLVPGVALPGVAIRTFLVVGCELALSTYSYCMETSRRGATVAPLHDCLFFLFVNPTVLYTARGTVGAVPKGFAGWERAGAGAALMFLNAAFLWPFVVRERVGTALACLPAGAPLTLLAYGVARFLSEYAAHSGLASIQIGLMRRTGWTVPERYRYPLLSRSPIDFWRRWNTYVRVWLEAYVFLPMARQVFKKTRLQAGQVAAAVGTLVVSAAIHGAVTFSGHQRIADVKRQVEFFLAAGALLAVWRIAGALGKAIEARLGPIQAGLFGIVARFSGHVSMAVALVAASITWG